METVKYWLGILSHVYYVQKQGKALLYNTQNGENIHTENHQVIDLLEQMHERKNLGVTEIDNKTYNHPDIKIFIKESVSKNICLFNKMIEGEPKPIQLMPILNLQRDVERLQKEEGRSLGEDVLHYLSDITIYINHSCELECAPCRNYFMQFFHCSQSFNAENVDFNLLMSFLKQLTFTIIRRLSITGGNIFLYPHFTELITFLQKEKIKPMFGIHSGNIDPGKMILLDDFPVEIFVSFPLEDAFVHNIVSQLKRKEYTKIIFCITSEEMYQQAESLISEYVIENYEYKAFYNGDNELFFKNNVYFSKDDLFCDTISQRMIFAHQKLNTNFFGKIYLFPNGDIKAHPSKESLGNSKREPLVKILEKEMRTNTAWRAIRDQTPCSECLYQFLCPSLSEYEWALNKSNLCNINF
ncbi:MAG: TIGR04150 pseudo-rSAM protein [Bacteroidetes bacterium]|nr:TIGR04150 pseudo-rSAM protein [Bacteroidota bacterium]MCL2302406.1 TIGR04150 pseudo-rSAM protein [Lentimicrobiaceae bacterium]